MIPMIIMKNLNVYFQMSFLLKNLKIDVENFAFSDRFSVLYFY